MLEPIESVTVTGGARLNLTAPPDVLVAPTKRHQPLEGRRRRTRVKQRIVDPRRRLRPRQESQTMCSPLGNSRYVQAA
jgi:hypothetical protein